MKATKFAKLTVAVVVVFSLSGCGMTASIAGTSPKTVTLKNGGTIECVVAAGTSGSVALDCVDATYVAPNK